MLRQFEINLSLWGKIKFHIWSKFFFVEKRCCVGKEFCDPTNSMLGTGLEVSLKQLVFPLYSWKFQAIAIHYHVKKILLVCLVSVIYTFTGDKRTSTLSMVQRIRARNGVLSEPKRLLRQNQLTSLKQALFITNVHPKSSPHFQRYSLISFEGLNLRYSFAVVEANAYTYV